MTSNASSTFTQLTEAWLNHEDLRRRQAPLSELAASRARLDSLRLQSFQTAR